MVKEVKVWLIPEYTDNIKFMREFPPTYTFPISVYLDLLTSLEVYIQASITLRGVDWFSSELSENEDLLKHFQNLALRLEIEKEVENGND